MSGLPFRPAQGGRGGGGGRGRGYSGGGDRGGGGGRGGRGGGPGRGRGGGPSVTIYRGGPVTPNPTVKSAEGAISKGILQKASQARNEPTLPQRPGYGTRGKEVLLWTNYFQLAVANDIQLHRYLIKISAPATTRPPAGKKLKRIIQLLREQHLPQNGANTLTDFKSILFSKTALDDSSQYDVLYFAEDEDGPDADAKTYQIRLEQTGTLRLSDLVDFVTSTNASEILQNKDELIQAMNVMIGQHPKQVPSIASVGANRHYDLAVLPDEKFSLGAGLSAVRGFFVSVRAATARVLVNVQVKHAAFFDEGPLAMLCRSFMSQNGPDKKKLFAFLKKLTVDVIHIDKRNKQGKRVHRCKPINGFATPQDGDQLPFPSQVSAYGAGPQNVKFHLSSAPPSAKTPSQGSSQKSKGKSKPAAGPAQAGKYISVYDYFKQNYPKIRIDNLDLPVINVGDRQNPSYLPMEACVVLPGQPSRSKLSPAQTQQMIRFAVRKPDQNATSIAMRGAQTLGFAGVNPTLHAFGVNVVPQLLVVPGRVLPSPAITYHRNQAISTRFGSWNLLNLQLAAGAACTDWTTLFINHGPNPWPTPDAFEGTLSQFTTALQAVGLPIRPPRPGLVININPSKPEAEIENAIGRFAKSDKPPKLVLVILPNLDSAIYNAVKYACDVKFGILNVCVLGSKFAKANQQYHTNVALKVNLKLGGTNHVLEPARLGIIAKAKTMVAGIDVTHPSPGSSSNAPSVASIVASVDAKLAQWPAMLGVQQGRQEMVAGLKEMFKSRLLLWQRRNKDYPENIIIYRDGVSEGQYNIVLDEELPQVQEACRELYPASKKGFPKITIIVVGKRHNTRFYPTTEADADRSSNPQNGTVVDRGVTEARNWDFFLQAHAAIQGTARPAHYYIIYDQIFRKERPDPPFQTAADVVEDLTHNMCYLFGRATKAVSICPPAYYADLACERARCYLAAFFEPVSGAASSASGATGTGGQAANASRVVIHQNVRDSMFYI